VHSRIVSACRQRSFRPRQDGDREGRAHGVRPAVARRGLIISRWLVMRSIYGQLVFRYFRRRRRTHEEDPRGIASPFQGLGSAKVTRARRETLTESSNRSSTSKRSTSSRAIAPPAMRCSSCRRHRGDRHAARAIPRRERTILDSPRDRPRWSLHRRSRVLRLRPYKPSRCESSPSPRASTLAESFAYSDSIHRLAHARSRRAIGGGQFPIVTYGKVAGRARVGDPHLRSDVALKTRGHVAARGHRAAGTVANRPGPPSPCGGTYGAQKKPRRFRELSFDIRTAGVGGSNKSFRRCGSFFAATSQ